MILILFKVLTFFTFVLFINSTQISMIAPKSSLKNSYAKIKNYVKEEGDFVVLSTKVNKTYSNVPF